MSQQQSISDTRLPQDIDSQAARAADLELMAECMQDTRIALIQAGVIDASVSPMFLADAVIAKSRVLDAKSAALGALHQAAAKAAAHLALYEHGDAGKDDVRRVALAELQRALAAVQAALVAP